MELGVRMFESTQYLHSNFRNFRTVLSLRSNFRSNRPSRDSLRAAAASVLQSTMPGKRHRWYCYVCERTCCSTFHSDKGEEFVYCNKCYYPVWKQLGGSDYFVHPTLLTLLNGVHEIDATGSLLHSLRVRADMQALRALGSLCETTRHWKTKRRIIFLCPLMLNLYFVWPMMDLWAELREIKPKDVTHSVLTRCLDRIMARYAQLRVKNGTLVLQSTGGLLVLKNPQERQQGTVRFLKLCAELDAWRLCSKSLESMFENSSQPVALSKALDKLGAANMDAYGDKLCYKNVRLVRSMIHMTNCTIEDSEEDWLILRSMSKHVATSLRKNGLFTYEMAIKFRDAMRQELRSPRYTSLT